MAFLALRADDRLDVFLEIQRLRRGGACPKDSGKRDETKKTAPRGVAATERAISAQDSRDWTWKWVGVPAIGKVYGHDTGQ